MHPRPANIVAAARNLFGRAKEYEEEFNMNPSHGVVLQVRRAQPPIRYAGRTA